jgi:serine/threonine protein kinase
VKLDPGDAVGPYRIESLIAEGGMGCVYAALTREGERVAVKLVKGELASDNSFRRRFDREARYAAHVSHPNVVEVVDAGVQSGIPYLVERFVVGRSLEEVIDEDGPLPLATVVRLCGQIAEALDAIHAEGIVHRDLKPANVMLDERNDAQITDFGLAKQRNASLLTMPGQAVGSLDYMAPEQVRGEEVSAASDVYALGCLMFTCLAGRPPFADRKGVKVLWAHLQDEPPDPCAEREDVPPGLGQVITSALAKDPSDRPPSASEYARRIREAAPSGPGSAEVR